MTLLRIFLGAFLLTLVAYTIIVISNHGMQLFPAFFGAIFAMNWFGQFNLDFMGFLILSAIWVAWRNQFSAAGLGLSVLALFGGMTFLPVYLLYLMATTNGCIGTVLLGHERVTTLRQR